MLLKTLKYFFEVAKEFYKQKSGASLFTAFKFFPAWLLSFKEPKNISEYIPWMNFEVIDFLKKKMSKNMTVFEWGSGSSTIFLSQLVKCIYSVEHDKNWHSKVVMLIETYKLYEIINYKLIEPEYLKHAEQADYSSPQLYLSSDNSFKNMTFESYAKEIDKYSDEMFDLVIVDGRARPSCVLHAMPKVKKNGYLLIDNTERDYYLEYFKNDNLLKNWELLNFRMLPPMLTHYCQTTILIKR